MKNKEEAEHTHDHLHGHTHTHHHSASKNIAVAFFLNFSFTIIEIVGGLLTNSVAILSDAIHDLGDSFSLALSWYFEKVSKRSPNKKFTYGYKRFSLIGALINSVILLVGSTIIITESVKRIIAPQEVHAKGMFFLAIAGIVINGIAVLRTRSKEAGINERVVSLHLLEDVLGWVAVLIGSIIMMFAEVPILDPLLSVGIAIYILYNVFKNLKAIFTVILQAVPVDIEINHLKENLLTIESIDAIHDLHLWSLDSQYNVASMHVVVKTNDITPENLHEIKTKVKAMMQQEGIAHTTIEFETSNEKCCPCV